MTAEMIVLFVIALLVGVTGIAGHAIAWLIRRAKLAYYRRFFRSRDFKIGWYIFWVNDQFDPEWAEKGIRAHLESCGIQVFTIHREAARGILHEMFWRDRIAEVGGEKMDMVASLSLGAWRNIGPGAGNLTPWGSPFYRMSGSVFYGNGKPLWNWNNKSEPEVKTTSRNAERKFALLQALHLLRFAHRIATTVPEDPGYRYDTSEWPYGDEVAA